MGKKKRKLEKKISEPLLSTPVSIDNEFEGLNSFEEIDSCSFLKYTKHGKFKRELWKDGKIMKVNKKKEIIEDPNIKRNEGTSDENKEKSKKKKKKKKKKQQNLKESIDKHVEDISIKNKKKIVSTNSPKESEVDVSKSKATPESLSKKNSNAKKSAKKRKAIEVPNNDCSKPKKACYNTITYSGSNDETKGSVDVSAWDSIFAPPEVLKALSKLGFSEPTEIQRLVLPAAIKGHMDIIGAAETGSGKTLAFGIPIINGILKDKQKEKEDLERKEDSGVENSGDDDSNASECEKDYNPSDCDDDDYGFDSSNCIETIDPKDFALGQEKGLYHSDDSENSDNEDDGDDDNDDDDDDDENGLKNIEMSSDEGSLGEDEDMDDSNGDKEIGLVKVIDNVKFDFLKENKPVKPLRALIITPTRELAIQIKSHLAAVLEYTDITMAVVVGGLALEKQKRILQKGPDIVVGTPGRLWEIIQQDNSHLSQVDSVKYLAIDETDRMIERGHFEELTSLLEKINSNEDAKNKRQNFVFSATLTLVHSLPKWAKMKKKKVNPLTSELKVKQLAKIIGLNEKPKVIDVTRKFGTAESLTESRIYCYKEEKDFYLYYFHKMYPGRTLVFCNSIDCVRRLQNLFTHLQCKPQSLHSSMHQKQRLKSLEYFSSNSNALLLATDVAARGLDIPNIQHVMHYQTPRTAETYIHRSGRTARATQEGLSVLFIDASEMNKYRQLCKTLNRSSDLPPFPVDLKILDQVKARVTFARELESKEHINRKARAEENWFKKNAREAGLLYDSESDSDQENGERTMKAAFKKRELKNMLVQLKRMLATPLTGSNFSGKYPTQSGTLIMPLSFSPNPEKDALSAVKKESVEFSKLVKKVKITTKKEKDQQGKSKRKIKGYEKRKLKMQKKLLEQQQMDKLIYGPDGRPDS